jgi:hypothetical protein
VVYRCWDMVYNSCYMTYSFFLMIYRYFKWSIEVFWHCIHTHDLNSLKCLKLSVLRIAVAELVMFQCPTVLFFSLQVVLHDVQVVFSPVTLSSVHVYPKALFHGLHVKLHGIEGFWNVSFVLLLDISDL